MPTSEPGAQALFEKIGTYILPGRVSDPVRGLSEAVEAERIGLGSVWISERYATKEPAVLSGAVSQLTKRVGICGTMYVTVRNPVVTASVCNLMQALSGGRFRLLLARGVASHLATIGSPPITFPRLKDFIALVRRLWAGETVKYEGITRYLSGDAIDRPSHRRAAADLPDGDRAEGAEVRRRAL